MNGLREQVATYLRVRRALGYKLIETERFLAQFADYLEGVGAEALTVEHALTWACLPLGDPSWHGTRLSAVRGFTLWAHTLDPAVQIPPAGLLPVRSRRATPYLYTDTQIQALMGQAAWLSTPLMAATYRTLIGLLAATGMRVGEAIGLDTDRFDPSASTVTITGAKFGKTRILPVHPSTVQALVGYLHVRHDRLPLARTPALLISTAGTRLIYKNVQFVFSRLARDAGITARSSACRPRLHDLRHTFAVNTLLDAYAGADNPAQRLPLLSTYLGHVHPADTYWYLSAAPELLAAAAQRLDRYDTGQGAP